MKRPFKEGDLIQITPTRFGRRGEAEGEYKGWRVRVRNGIPGEDARVRILHVSRGGPVATGRFHDAAAPHSARRDPPCPIHDPCGGCGLQHVDETFAFETKVGQARALLQDAQEWRPGVISPRRFGYRAKTFMLPQRRGSRLLLGARPPRGEALVDTSGCAVLRPELESLAARTREALADRPELAQSLRSVLLRCNRAGQTQLTLVHAGATLDLAGVARSSGADAAFLQRHDEPGNVICSDAEETAVLGEPITESFDGLRVTVPPTAFCQGNPAVAESLYRLAAEELAGPRIGELYCGAGAAGLLALRKHEDAELHGVDRSPRAIATARFNAAANDLAARCRFETAAAESVAAEWDSVLVNPPRAGCHEQVLAAIQKSGAARLVYISCSPATLARDAERLGWPLASVTPADMFPQTPHLEMLAVFTRP